MSLTNFCNITHLSAAVGVVNTNLNNIISIGIIVVGVVVGVLVLLACLWFVLAVFIARSLFAIILITDISQCSNILQYWSKELTQHFPTTLPPHATDMRFFYQSSLRGGNILQLRCKLPSQQIKRLLTEYRALATHRFFGGSKFDDVNKNRLNGVPTTHFFTNISDYRTFPAFPAFPVTYEILVLSADTGGSYAQHGYSCGLAIDSSTSDIVYWAEHW